MMIKLRKQKRAQSLVIVALSATALFGIIALGLDAGRLYFQRRDVQNAADAGALAGAQELIPTGANTVVTTQMITAADCQASVYALVALIDTPRDGGCTPSPSGAYTPASLGSGISEPANKISATVQVWTPSRGNSNEIHVRVTYNVPLTFAAVLGFTTSAVVADAYAHAGFYKRPTPSSASTPVGTATASTTTRRVTPRSTTATTAPTSAPRAQPRAVSSPTPSGTRRTRAAAG